ncbi:(2Fe-2S)-binding protein [Acidiferrimicrobium sp. IK]|uniref:(2Fe-2S)-binding protein n=1 Tax=Acidiferrimicrobium sp. IK TaxID=2871700 RepID=UPI0021CB5F2C|nr:(2Fe-2S)-binding protein [Acidiferrimicrobium sp. IK]MCU4184442.1 (2Fe-2S)-binding protein [Acidiferrimicrobium sp. IK]
MTLVPINLTVNGERHAVAVEARKLLSDVLREDLHLTGTHVGCEHGACGACTVLLDGQAVRSCLLFAIQLDRSEITTVEGLAGGDGTLNRFQAAMQECHGLQCGFCTPGVVVSMTAYLADHDQPDDEDLRVALSGNLCRCTGYQGIVNAARLSSRGAAVAGGRPGSGPTA